ncbi:restriction endonuclease subunit S, partial [Bacillus sp. GMs2/1]|uniref:restriction endonuclease subunit S n=1 Tax=Bacillus sp. GMs2/1 TaxID=3418493 RepID=UPI003CEF0AF8
GVSYKPGNIKEGNDNKDFVLIRSNNIKNGTISLKDVIVIDKSCVSEVQRLNFGDIVVCMSNGSKELVGKSAMFKETVGDYCVGAFCSSFKSIDNNSNEFIYYLFQSDEYRKQVDISLAGSAINNLKNSTILNYEFLVPLDKAEQEKIANVLIKIDESIEKIQKLINKYNRIKIGMMQDLLTKGIDEEGNIRSEETHEFRDSPLGRIPTEYFCENFGEYANFKNGLNYNSEQVGEGLKIIGVSNFKSHMTIGYQGLDELRGFERINPEYLLNDSDLLFVRSNGNKELIGRVLLIEKIKEPISFSGFTIRARIINSAINARYIAYLFNASLIRKQLVQFGGGTNIANLSQEILSKIKILIPPTEEQKKIVNVLDKINQKIDQQKALLYKVQNLKAGLMQDLLTGKVSVTDLILEDVGI